MAGMACRAYEIDESRASTAASRAPESVMKMVSPIDEAAVGPLPGDVLITTTDRGHSLSIVPHPHRVSFAQLPAAIDIALRWAKANNATVWRTANSKTFRWPELARRTARSV
jgi:hypothetical protein